MKVFFEEVHYRLGSVQTFDFVCEANVFATKPIIFNPNDLGTISPFRGHGLRELSPLKINRGFLRFSLGHSLLHWYLAVGRGLPYDHHSKSTLPPTPAAFKSELVSLVSSVQGQELSEKSSFSP